MFNFAAALKLTAAERGEKCVQGPIVQKRSQLCKLE